MIRIEIPGREALEIAHVVLDYNGTIAVDGALLPPVRQRLEQLKEVVEIHVLPADTYGTVQEQCRMPSVAVHTFPRAGAAACKAEIVSALEGGVACFGNGFNDIPMFEAAGYPVGMGNILPEADPHTRYRTASCDGDGVANVIRSVLAGTLENLRKEP